MFVDGSGVVEGQIYLGGQEHFYFEPHISIAYPADNEMNIITSTQNLNKTQYHVALALAMPASKVSDDRSKCFCLFFFFFFLLV